MKALFCTLCFDIRGLDPDGAWTPCRCGNMAARWIDANKGTVSVKATNRERARILGMNNQMLTAAVNAGSHDDECWKKKHDEATNAKGYIFDKSARDCWACIVRVGETGDITWEPGVQGSGG